MLPREDRAVVLLHYTRQSMALTGPPSASMNPDVDAETGGGSTTSTNNTNNRSSSNKKLVEIALSPPRDKNGSTQTMVVVRSGGEAGRITDVRVSKVLGICE